MWAAGQWSVCERGAPRGVGRALQAAFPAAGSQREAFPSQRISAPPDKGREGKSRCSPGGGGSAFPGCCASRLPGLVSPGGLSRSLRLSCGIPLGCSCSPGLPGTGRIAAIAPHICLLMGAGRIFHLFAMPSSWFLCHDSLQFPFPRADPFFMCSCACDFVFPRFYEVLS